MGNSKQSAKNFALSAGIAAGGLMLKYMTGDDFDFTSYGIGYPGSYSPFPIYSGNLLETVGNVAVIGGTVGATICAVKAGLEWLVEQASGGN